MTSPATRPFADQPPRQPKPLATASLKQSAVIMVRVLWALMMREVLTRYGRHNIGFFWLFIEPMLFSVGVTALWTFTGMGHESNLPITAFAVTGYSCVLLWRNMPNRAAMAVTANLPLLYHRNVRPLDIIVARLLLETVSVTMSFVILTIVFHALEWMEWPEDILQLAFAWIMTIWFGMALALVLGTLGEMSELIEKLWHPAAYLIFPLSGAAFIVDAMPKAYQNMILWLPMVHCNEMIREAYFGSKIIAHYDVGYLTFCNLLLTLLGVTIERHVSGKVQPE